MPSESGMAVVLIQPLAPDHENPMAELLSRYTTMPVVEVEHRMRMRPNHVYLIPPNKYPVDFFFCSLAEDRYARAGGIVRAL